MCTENDETYLISLRHGLDLKGYVLGELLGRGAFAGCFKVVRKLGNFTFACKVIHTMSDTSTTLENLRESYDNEMSILKNIIHPNVISVYDFFTIDCMYVIILEYCPNGTIEDLMKQNPCKYLSKTDLIKYSSELVDAIEVLHSNNIAHHDIKPSNCLIDKYGRLKLSDFGLAKKYATAESEIRKGTLLFVSPEIISFGHYDPFKSDIWSIGVTFYIMMTGRPPFKEKRNISILREEQNHFVCRASSYRNKVEVFMTRLINLCLTVDPSQRPSIRQLQSEFKKFKSTPSGMLSSFRSLPQIGLPMPLTEPEGKKTARPDIVRPCPCSPLVSSKNDFSPQLTSRDGQNMPLAMRSPLDVGRRLVSNHRRALSMYRSGNFDSFIGV